MDTGVKTDTDTKVDLKKLTSQQLKTYAEDLSKLLGEVNDELHHRGVCTHHDTLVRHLDDGKITTVVCKRCWKVL